MEKPNFEMIAECLHDYANLLGDGEIDGAGRYLPDDIDEQADLITALSAAPVEVKVRELEFTEDRNGDFCASTIVGPYLIAAPRAPTHRWKLYRYAGESHPSSYPDFESAHEAANADFASRIAPVLEPAPVSAEPQPVASIVPDHCSGSALVFVNGVLHVSKDGSGYIAVNEDDFELEDDRCEGPDGPEGSVHWITRFPAGEMTALRDFLNGQRFTSPPDLGAEIARLREALEATRALVCEGAMVGFNPLDGDWAERLYRNNGNITAALNGAALADQKGGA